MGIVYPQRRDPAIPIDQYGCFDIMGMIPPITKYGIWGCLHFLLLVSNVFLACYDSGTFLSHLTEGGYGFDVLGSPGLDMYQMYVVVPMVKAGMTYLELASSTNLMVYLPEALRDEQHFSELSSIDVKVKSMWLQAKHISFERGGVLVPSVAPCQLGYVLTPSSCAQV